MILRALLLIPQVVQVVLSSKESHESGVVSAHTTLFMAFYKDRIFVVSSVHLDA
jgi:hypothetical protein